MSYLGLSEKEILALMDTKLKFLTETIVNMKERQVEMNKKLSALQARKSDVKKTK